MRSLAFAISITAAACIRSQLLSWHGNSLHPHPVACTAAACIRTQLHPLIPASAALRPPGSICAAMLSLSPQKPASAASCSHGTATACIRSQLNPLCNEALHSALKGSVCAALLLRSLSRQQPASAVGCSRCSKPAFSASCILLSMTALHSALKGSVCAALPSLSLSRQQPAVAAGCLHGSSLHSQSAAHAQHDSAALRLEGLRLRSLAFAVSITATACSRSRLLSWHGNSPHSQPVACMAASLHPHAAAFGACSGSMPPDCAASLRYMPLTRYECYGWPHNPVHYCCFSFAFGRVWSWRFAVELLAQRLDAPSLYSLPPLHSAAVPRRRRAFTRSTLLQQRRRAAAMPKRVQAKRRLRTAATLTLWAAVQPGAFLLFQLCILEWLNWRLALLICTFGGRSGGMAKSQSIRNLGMKNDAGVFLYAVNNR